MQFGRWARVCMCGRISDLVAVKKKKVRNPLEKMCAIVRRLVVVVMSDAEALQLNRGLCNIGNIINAAL